MLVRSIETGQEYNLCLPDPLTGRDTLLALVHNLDYFHYGHPQFFKVAETPYYEANQDTIDWWVGYLAVRAEAERADAAFCVRLDELPHEIADYWHRKFLRINDHYYSDELAERSQGLLTAVRRVTAEMDRCDDFPPCSVTLDALVKRVRRKLARSMTILVKVPRTSPWEAGEFMAVDRRLLATPIKDLGDYARALGVLRPDEFVLPVMGASA